MKMFNSILKRFGMNIASAYEKELTRLIQATHANPKGYNVEQLKLMISLAVERNLIVSDASADGNITKKLLYLMLNVNDDDIQRVYIPRESYPEFDPWGEEYGMKFTRVKELNHGGILMDHYSNELSGALPSNCDSLLVAVGSKNILLGAC
jgi:hypothetical protein